MMEETRLTELNKLTELIIGSAIEVHKELGPGLLESAYEIALFHELTVVKNLKVQRQLPVEVNYKDIPLEVGYRIDLLVEDQIVVELKAVDKLTDVHLAQILTYLKLGNFNLGLMINFNEKLLKTGIRRVLN